MDGATTASPTSALHDPDLDDRQVCCHVFKDAHIPNIAPANTAQMRTDGLFPHPSCQNPLRHL